jgi:hypothetical protein
MDCLPLETNRTMRMNMNRVEEDIPRVSESLSRFGSKKSETGVMRPEANVDMSSFELERDKRSIELLSRCMGYKCQHPLLTCRLLPLYAIFYEVILIVLLDVC